MRRGGGWRVGVVYPTERIRWEKNGRPVVQGGPVA